MANSLLITILLAALDNSCASTEQMTIIETAPSDCQLVDSIAFVTLPEPAKWVGWGRIKLCTGFEFGAVNDSCLPDGNCDWRNR